MLSLTAFLHTRNDALRLGRCLETAYPCDEIVIVDHGSTDATLHVAREYGARIVPARAVSDPPSTFDASRLGATEWILCLDPRESLSEALAASLFEWKSNHAKRTASPCAMFLREEEAHGWVENPIPQTRLVPASWQEWNGQFPVHQQPAATLDGKLLRFRFP
jgi:glycosyltransferase involved in cell wall biosynthesis